EDVRRAPQLGVACEPQRCDDRTATLALELVYVSAYEPAATRSLERGIGGQLDDVRRAGQLRTERAPSEHARRVNDVVRPRAVLHECCAAVVPHTGPMVAK